MLTNDHGCNKTAGAAIEVALFHIRYPRIALAFAALNHCMFAFAICAVDLAFHNFFEIMDGMAKVEVIC